MDSFFKRKADDIERDKKVKTSSCDPEQVHEIPI